MPCMLGRRHATVGLSRLRLITRVRDVKKDPMNVRPQMGKDATRQPARSFQDMRAEGAAGIEGAGDAGTVPLSPFSHAP